MGRENSPIDDIQQPLQQVSEHPWFEKLARFGYAARGVVYFVVGLLAAQAAFGNGGKTTDSEGALQTIVTQPFGKFLLAIVTVGLIGYALWHFVQAILDPEHSRQKNDAKRVGSRIGSAVAGITYAGLAVTAVKLIMGSGSGGNSNSTQDWTARLLAQPFGRWLVGFVGIIIIGFGIYQLYEAFKAKFFKKFNTYQMNQSERTWTKWIGQFGIAARGIVFSIIGIFLARAALKSDPNQAKGLGEALATLPQQPFGLWILGIVAIGLMAFSIYSVILARYRHFDT